MRCQPYPEALSADLRLSAMEGKSLNLDWSGPELMLDAIQAYNEYVHLQHQSETDIKRRGLSRKEVAREVFRKLYGA